MFNWKKEEKRKPNARKSNLSQFGLMDIPDDFDASVGDNVSDGDSDLEAELMAITSGSGGGRPKRGKPPAAASANLDAMVAASMRDIPSDEEISGDEDDPDLLAELSELAPDEEKPAAVPRAPEPRTQAGSSGGQVALLERRMAMYREAETNAKQAGEAARAKRFSRGLKTLGDQLKQARAGSVVPEDQIPPEVSTKPAGAHSSDEAGTSAAAELPQPPRLLQPAPDLPPQAPVRPSRAAPPPPVVSPRPAPPVPSHPATPPPCLPEPPREQLPAEEEGELAELLRRQLQFKQAALGAKKSGDSDTALKYLRISKQFDSVIAAVKSGNPVDLSEMPQCPGAAPVAPRAAPVVPSAAPVVPGTAPVVPGTAPPPVPQPREAEVQRSAEEGEGEEAPEPLPTPKGSSLPPELVSPPPPSSVAEALTQRLARYQAEERLAKEQSNTSKARRMGRIVKQYQDAIKLHKAGKPIPVDELPTPPGYAAIPVPGAPAPPPAATLERDEAPDPPQPPTVAPPTPPKVAKPAEPDTPSAGLQRTASEVRKSPQSRQEKQTALLLERQREFKEAALAAKRRGELEQARELLRQAKGFDSLLQASAGGLPVDLATLPVSPGAAAALDPAVEQDFEYVSTEDCTPGGAGEIYEKLEEDLNKQIKLCLVTRDHFKATGDVASGNRFEQLAVQSKRDLNMVKACRQRGETLPRFRYETRSFSIVQCCTDLGDNDLELNIVQGINYTVPNPKEVDTYVKFEFPFPTETPVRDKTALVRDTNNPQYNQSFPLTIARTSRACQRVFKRHGVKLEVWSKGGFLRGDTLLGTATVKLQPLENKCVLHDSFPLMDGRKAVGGQLEVKVRVRHPLVTRQVEQRQERWLVLAEH